MQIAIWNHPAAAFLVSGFTTGTEAGMPGIKRESPRGCEHLLRTGQVEVALLPALTVLRHTDAFDVLPAVALSTWKYPFARLVLKQSLHHPIHTLAFDPRYGQEALVAQLILREHYGITPSFVPYDEQDPRLLLKAEDDAVLLVGAEVPTIKVEGLSMDLGQEWYELVNYPMVWGLFVTRKDEAPLELVNVLHSAIRMAERQRDLWAHALDTTVDLHAFYQNDLRVRFDDLAMASLTEFRQYLFYQQAVEDLPDIPFIKLQDHEEDEQPLE